MSKLGLAREGRKKNRHWYSEVLKEQLVGIIPCFGEGEGKRRKEKNRRIEKFFVALNARPDFSFCFLSSYRDLKRVAAVMNHWPHIELVHVIRFTTISERVHFVTLR